MLKNCLLFLFFAFATILLVECLLHCYSEFSQQRADASVTSYYIPTLTDSQGQKVTHRTGELKLSLDPFTVYRNTPGVLEKRYSTNDMGFRGKEIEKRSPSTKRIVIIGGSTAFGTGLNSDNETISAKLCVYLPGYEIVNAATIGHGSGQELSVFVHSVLDLEPEILINIDAWNDFALQLYMRKPSYNLGTLGFYQVEEKLKDYYLLSEPNMTLRYVNLISRGLFPKISSRIGKLFQNQTPPSSPIITDIQLLAESYFKNIKKINTIAKAYGIKHLVVLQPDARNVLANQYNWNWQAKDYEKFRLYIIRLLKDSNIPFFDLNNLDKFKKSDFMDAIHLNSEGNEKIAAKISELVPTLYQKEK